MASLLVWGRTRELIGGSLPPGLSVHQASKLAEVQAFLDNKGGTLVLADPRLLDAEREAFEGWFKAGGSLRAVFVAVGETADADELIRRYPYLDDVMAKPITAPRLRLRLDRALDALHNRRVIQQLDQALGRK